MNNTAEQFIATNQANLQTLEGLTTQAFAGVEKLVELNMQASKALLGESFSHMQAVLGAKNPQEFLALQSASLKPLAEKSAAFFQHIQAIASGSSAEFTKTVEAKTAEAQNAFSDAVENLAKHAPAGSESAVAAFKSALTAGQSAVESAQTSAKKAVEAAQSNFTAAATQAVDAVKKATKVA
ncbi:phasin family protein [Polaromonas sp.]|uniref:phasin family protein n=1 Tax=Polaromonas sp. TaxID=1869339 RepID=UPI00286A0733|nr:phasin family protein [Polaromonas sp.]